MRVRPIFYAALFTAGVEALAIYSTQEPASDRVPPTQIALTAAAPTNLGTAIPSTPVAQYTADAGAAMAATTEKLKNLHQLYDTTARRYRIVRRHRMARQQQAFRQQQKMSMTFATGNY